LEEGEDVIFTGFVDEEDLPQVYSSAEATLLWSHYEGFGRSALESEACGTPAIAPDKPPMNEWLPEDRFGQDQGDTSVEMSSRSWSQVAEETAEVYRSSVLSEDKKLENNP
ncbi:MAG: glycosyltransferase, partial [Candidatus Aenigmatarchaeota archaeon]